MTTIKSLLLHKKLSYTIEAEYEIKFQRGKAKKYRGLFLVSEFRKRRLYRVITGFRGPHKRTTNSVRRGISVQRVVAFSWPTRSACGTFRSAFKGNPNAEKMCRVAESSKWTCVGGLGAKNRFCHSLITHCGCSFPSIENRA